MTEEEFNIVSNNTEQLLEIDKQTRQALDTEYEVDIKAFVGKTNYGILSTYRTGIDLSELFTREDLVRFLEDKKKRLTDELKQLNKK